MQKRESPGFKSPEVDISANGEVVSAIAWYTILPLSFLHMALHSMDVTKSQLLANFTGWKRVHHKLKLLWKTKTWGKFVSAVEQKASLTNKKKPAKL